MNVAYGQRTSSYSEAKKKLDKTLKDFAQSNPHDADDSYWRLADSLESKLYQFLKFPQSYKYNFDELISVIGVTLLIDSIHSGIGTLRLVYFDVSENESNGMISRHGFVQWLRKNQYEVYRQDEIFKGIEKAEIASINKLSDSTFLVLSSNWTTQIADVYRLKQNSFIKQKSFFPILSDSDTNSVTNCVQSSGNSLICRLCGMRYNQATKLIYFTGQECLTSETESSFNFIFVNKRFKLTIKQ